MIWILTIIAFLVIFSVLILVHEFGHFITAKKCGIKVEEFGLGLPPKVWGFKPKKSETIYTINAIPFGGFVRLYGEDTRDAKLLKNNRSYAAKPAWMKILVVCAGVVMNFLLAFVLLTIGFTVGMQPLLVDQQDIVNAVNNGTINLKSGLLVKETGENDIGLQKGDRVVAVNGRTESLDLVMATLKDQEQVKFVVERAGENLSFQGINDLNKKFFQPYEPFYLPEVVVLSMDEESPLRKFGVQEGDTVVSLNGVKVFDEEQLQEMLKKSVKWDFEVKRADNLSMRLFTTNDGDVDPKIIITEISPESPAEKAGVMVGDKILEINGEKITSVTNLPIILKKSLDGKMIYKVLRGNSVLEFYMKKNEQGVVGVMLSEIKYNDLLKAKIYAKSSYYSVLEIKDVRLPFWEAPVESFREMGRLSVLTAQMFVGVFGKLFTQLSVPEGVAGPVGIFQMTHGVVQEGVVSLIRFTAILSLSLAIINILPFPGLDGGRLFLILVPLILRRKLNHKLEAIIHLIGFVILMLLIFLVTFNDILRFFGW